MKIGIISDIHDNFYPLQETLKRFETENVESILFCGDFGSPGSAKHLANNFKGDIYAVIGNNDADLTALTTLHYDNSNKLKFDLEQKALTHILTLEGIKFSITHYPLIAEQFAKAGEVDFSFFGHTHQKFETKIKDCVLANPGAIMPDMNKKCRYAILDTQTKEITFEEFDLKI